MDAQKLRDILGQQVEVPHMVDKKLENTYSVLEGKQRPARRKKIRPVRTVLIAAALIAALCVTATAAYQIFRQDVVVDKPQLVQGILGGGTLSWEQEENYDQMGRLSYWPKRELVPVDEEQAMALLGDYLPESGYQWQIDDYTFTVEGYVLDEHTGTGRIYYSLEHPGGFPEGSVDWEHGVLDYTKYGPIFFGIETRSDTDWPWMGSGLQYVDTALSTEEKLVLVEGLCTQASQLKAADGLTITVSDSTKGKSSKDRFVAALEVPGVESLPAVTVTNPETGEAAVRFSAVGMMVDTRYLTSHLPNGDEVHEALGYLALEYADGTSYVIYDTGLDNADYACYDVHSVWLRVVFNRLVDPSQVTAVIVDDQRYEVK